MSENQWYYRQLNKKQQQAYYCILEGISSLAPSFYVPRLPAENLSDIWCMLRLDHPEIFWAEHFSYRYYDQAENIEMIPEYLFKKKQIQEHQKAMEARVLKLIRGTEKMTVLEKEQFIHDFICNNVRYDKLKKQYSHEIIGPLGQGVGVCEGIAKTVKTLCDRMGIWCIIVLSDNNPQKGIKYRHTWNIVKLDGKYYHLDATFDNSLTSDDVIRYDYFNLNDTQIFRDHEPAFWCIPACEDGKHAWYIEKKIALTKIEDVEKRARQALKKNKTLLFQWRGSYLTREQLTQFFQLLDNVAAEKNKCAYASINWPQAVIQCSFTERDVLKEFVVENANLAELIE